MAAAYAISRYRGKELIFSTRTRYVSVGLSGRSDRNELRIQMRRQERTAAHARCELVSLAAKAQRRARNTTTQARVLADAMQIRRSAAPRPPRAVAHLAASRRSRRI